MTEFSNLDLPALYRELNAQFFDGLLPACDLRWSRRLTRTAGHIRPALRQITLSVPLLVNAWHEGASFEVCGIRCDSAQHALREILKHEMIHLWLYVNGQPHGHTHAFRAKAKQIGQPKTRHAIPSSAPKHGWVYVCVACRATTFRRRRYGRAVACAKCCKAHNGGQFDERFRLRGQRAHFVKPEALKGMTKWPPK